MSQHISNPYARANAVSQQVSRNPAPTAPTVNKPSFFQNYFENQTPASVSSNSSTRQNLSGYSPAHLQYQDERKRWASMAYKQPGQIPLRAQARQEVRVVFQLSHQLLSGKVEKIAVRLHSVPHSYF